MNYNEISKVKGLVSLNTALRSSHIMDGDYRSRFRGESLDFDELSEYHYGDNIRHIDWKASSAQGKTMVRRYIAQKRQKVLFLMDCGVKMTGHTPQKVLKSELACSAMSAFAWLFSSKGCDYSLLCSDHAKIGREAFHGGIQHLPAILDRYKKNVNDINAVPFQDLLKYAIHSFAEEMILVLITDLEGLTHLDEKLVKALTYRKELMVICLDDTPLLTGNAFDLDHNSYANLYFLRGRKLKKAEARMRASIFEEKKQLLLKNRGGLVMISEEEEIVNSIMTLFQQIYKRS